MEFKRGKSDRRTRRLTKTTVSLGNDYSRSFLLEVSVLAGEKFLTIFSYFRLEMSLLLDESISIRSILFYM